MACGNEAIKATIDHIKKNHAQECLHFFLSDEKASFTGSRIGGMPYWPGRKPYPKGEDGSYLTFLLQINLSDCPLISSLPECGLLQIFLRDDSTYGCDLINHSSKNIAIVLHKGALPDLTESDVKKNLLLEGADPEIIASDGSMVKNSPVKGISALRAEKGISLPAMGDWQRYNRVIKEGLNAASCPCETAGPAYVCTGIDEFGRIKNAMRRVQVPSGEKEVITLLGYPDFKKINPLPDNSDLRLLMKINSVESDKCTVNWLADGIANFFITPAALSELDFSDIYYTWDFDSV